MFQIRGGGVLFDKPWGQSLTDDVMKLGDSRRCGVCGGVTTLRMVQPSAATLGWVDDRSTPYEIPSLPMWQCDTCDDLQPPAGELEI